MSTPTKSVLKSKTTYTIGVAATIVPALVLYARAQWPTLMFWPESSDPAVIAAIIGGITAITTRITAHILAWLKENKNKHPPIYPGYAIALIAAASLVAGSMTGCVTTQYPDGRVTIEPSETMLQVGLVNAQAALKIWEQYREYVEADQEAEYRRELAARRQRLADIKEALVTIQDALQDAQATGAGTGTLSKIK